CHSSFPYPPTPAGFYEEDDSLTFAGELDADIEVRVSTPLVRAGESVKGLCVVKNEPNQAAYNFKIVRVTERSEEVLDDKAYFSFVVDAPEDVEGLVCRASINDIVLQKEFNVEFTS
ncbi:hypothetical protein Ciccas_012760, partial [Cichlidogyrus casuarinus]